MNVTFGSIKPSYSVFQSLYDSQLVLSSGNTQNTSETWRCDGAQTHFTSQVRWSDVIFLTQYHRNKVRITTSRDRCSRGYHVTRVLDNASNINHTDPIVDSCVDLIGKMLW